MLFRAATCTTRLETPRRKRATVLDSNHRIRNDMLMFSCATRSGVSVMRGSRIGCLSWTAYRLDSYFNRAPHGLDFCQQRRGGGEEGVTDRLVSCGISQSLE